MPVNLGTPEEYIGPLLAGQLIEFSYSGTTRWGVVVTPSWKDNCDCYVFDSKEEVPEELLEWAGRRVPSPGEAYTIFGNQYTFKSFKLDTMSSIQNIEFDTYREEKVTEVTADQDASGWGELLPAVNQWE